MAPQRAPSSFSRGKACDFSSWSHILKTVSLTYKELAGERKQERAPRIQQRVQNGAEKCVQGIHPTPHTPQITTLQRTGGCLWPFLRKLVTRPRVVYRSSSGKRKAQKAQITLPSRPCWPAVLGRLQAVAKQAGKTPRSALPRIPQHPTHN